MWGGGESSTVQAKAQDSKDVKGPCIRAYEHARDPKAGSEKQFLKKQGWGWRGGSAGGGICSPGPDLLYPHGRERERESSLLRAIP